MKTRIQKLLVGAALVGAATLVQAQLNYTDNGNGTCTITGYTGPGGAVTIPNSINGLTVVSIGYSAFRTNSSLTSVTIPASTGIGSFAFYDCTNLTSVIMSNGFTFIGEWAFSGCTSLTIVIMSNGVTQIGDFSFSGCTSLTSVTIPGSVIDIGKYAFYYCTSLTNVTIPSSVTSIGDFPFYGCTSLTAITVDAGNSVYSSVDGVLFNKSQTTLIGCPGGKAGSYALPGSVTSIGNGAFYYCTALTSVTIPGSVTNIGNAAFVNCTSLTSVRISNSVTNIPDSAFENCPSLTSITIPSSVTSIGNYAFDGCTSLTSVTIPGSVTNIGDSAFAECFSLNGVFFNGNAPGFVGADVFLYTDDATVYYLPGATGWGATFVGRPAVLWNPLMQTSGVGPGGFGFNIAGTADIPIVIEAAGSLANPAWVPLQSLNLTNGAFYFSDPNWMNHLTRFYRIRSP